MGSTRSFVRAGYSLYTRSFLHPHLGGLIKHGFRLRSRFVAREPFVHDVGPFRMYLDLDQLIDTSIYYMGTWEGAAVAAIRRFLPEGGTGVDIGANIGFMTLHMAARVGPGGHVLAFEPNAWAAGRLAENLALNDLSHVTLARVGLSDRPSVQVDVATEYSYPLIGPRPVMRDTVVIQSLDGYLATHPVERLDVVKCDTDGWEVRVLEGAAATLRRFRPRLVLEVNPAGLAEHGDTVGRLVTLLCDSGYEIFHEDGEQPFPDLEASTRHLARTQHDVDIVALPTA